MNVIHKYFLSLIFFFCIQIVYCIDINGKEIEACITGEYNRSINYIVSMSAVGGIEFNNMFKFRSGVSVGKSEDGADINAFLSGRYYPFSKIPFSFSLAYIYNGLPEYESHTHSIFPFISYNTRRAGVSIGPNFRFSSFFGETAQFESIISSCVYFNFINNDVLRIGVSVANFNEFYAKNMGAYSLSINTVIRLDYNWFLINEFELMQSGGDGFTTNFYGFCWRGGARFAW